MTNRLIVQVNIRFQHIVQLQGCIAVKHTCISFLVGKNVCKKAGGEVHGHVMIDSYTSSTAQQYKSIASQVQ